MSVSFWRVFSMLLALTVLPISAQTLPSSLPVPPPVPAEGLTPKDAKERMELAKKVNGLLGMVTPWHLKARYEILAEDGKSVETGTYEEWRVDATQYRIALHGPSASVEEYGTDHGIFRTSQQSWPGKPLSTIRTMVERPVSSPVQPEKTELKNFERSLGSSSLLCTALLVRGSKLPDKDAASYCFDKTNSLLVYASDPNKQFQTLFQSVVLVNGHYLAKEMQLFLVGQLWLKVHVDSIAGLPAEERTALAVPVDATLGAARTSAPDDLTRGKLIRKAVPAYPPAARMQGVQGTVLINGIIGTDGHLQQLQVLAGPQMLRQTSLETVRQWVYSPYLLDGQPIEVETDINVVFALGQ
jgi:TonB family protein